MVYRIFLVVAHTVPSPNILSTEIQSDRQATPEI